MYTRKKDIIRQLNTLEDCLYEYMRFAVEKEGPKEEIWIDENNNLVVSLDGEVMEFWSLDLSDKLRFFEEF